MLVKKYHDTHYEDNEMLITITKAIDASPELRSKKELIENFIAGINDVEDVMTEWHDYVAEMHSVTVKLRLPERILISLCLLYLVLVAETEPLRNKVSSTN